MNYFFLVYPVISLLSFFLIFLYPAGALLFLFLSFLTALWYCEDVSRTKITDICFIFIIIVGGVVGFEKLLYFLPTVIVPVIILYLCRRRLSPLYLPILLASLPIALMTAGMIVFSDDFRNAVTGEAIEYIKKMSEQMGNGAQRLDVTGLAAYFFTDAQNTAKTLVNLIPGITYSFMAVLIYMADKAKPKNDGKNIPIIRDFRLPDFFVWILIISGFLILIKNYNLRFLCYNILIIFSSLYLLQGVQLFGILFDRLKLSRFIRMFAYIFVAIEPHLMLVISSFGLFSIWFRPKVFTRAVETGEKKDGSI